MALYGFCLVALTVLGVNRRGVPTPIDELCD
jgi:hypothetical protein